MENIMKYWIRENMSMGDDNFDTHNDADEIDPNSWLLMKETINKTIEKLDSSK